MFQSIFRSVQRAVRAALIIAIVPSILGAGQLAQAVELKAVGPGCYANRECPGDLVCRYNRCISECTQDRDCASGQRCGAAQRCEAIVLPGTVAGRVEKAPGEPIACEARLGGRSVKCDASGEFILEQVPAGRHRLVISAKVGAFNLKRALTAFVAGGQTFYLGVVTVAPLLMTLPAVRPGVKPALKPAPGIRLPRIR